MGPEEAVAAASILGARLTVPIHYDTINHPPAYTQVDHPAERFSGEAAAACLETQIVEAGEPVPLPSAA